jgi:mannosyltransferase
VVWHAHRIHELLAGMFLRLISPNIKLVWTRHGIGPPSRLTQMIVRRADHLISVSPEAAGSLGLPSSIVTHGVDLERFSPPADRPVAWQSLGLPGRLGVGVVGRIRPDKGQGDFVEAIGPLVARYPDWCPVLVGFAKRRDRKWIDALCRPYAGRIHRIGEQRNIERWYQGLSVVVVPSHVESYGLVRLEAMAAGCCLVTTRLNVLDRAIENGKTGFVYEAGDIQGLREILDLLMREPARAEAIGANAAELARGRFGITHETQALLSIYQSIGSLPTPSPGTAANP